MGDTRAEAIAFMQWDGMAEVCGQDEWDRTTMQIELHQLLIAITLDPRVPVDVVSRLGRVVRLANEIGQGNP